MRWAITCRWSTATDFFPAMRSPFDVTQSPVWMRERRNGLLAGLPAGELARVAPYLEDVAMPLGMALYESGAELRYVYLSTTGIVSLLYVMEDGAPRKSPSSATKAWSASRCSWAVRPRRAAPWCRARATATG